MCKLLRLFSLLLLLLSSHLANGQILNIEKFRLDTDSSNVWMGNLNLGFTSKKQNTTVTTINSTVNLVYLSTKHSYLTIGRVNFIFVEDSKLISEGYGHVRANLWRKKTLSHEPFFQYQFDIGRGLHKRLLYGFTFRVQLKAHDKYTLGLNSGVMYEEELWRGEVIRKSFLIEEGIAETKFLKNTTSLSLRATLSPQVSLFLTTYYQARFEDFFRPRVISDISLMLKISNRFAFTNTFVSNFDAAPILAENEFVYTFNSTFTIKF
ncbi:MAG TPA: DUF481 domain-containing protein [Cytophagaceae bacterium]